MPEEASLIGHGISANATLDAENFKDKHVIVVGGGDAALEQALLLSESASSVTIIHKDSQFYASNYLQERVFTNTKINFEFESTITQILGADEGYVKGAILQNISTQEKITLECEGIIVANGRKPNTDLFIGQLEMTEKGYIVTKPDSSLTTIPGVFAAGDITHAAYRKVTTAVASGCMSAIDVVKFFATKK